MTQPEAPYGIIIAKDVMVPMRDGVRLATDIYYPARDGERVPGAHPTILIRTSYDKAAVRYVETVANYFTPRGYVTVQQDLRGRYNSEGRGQYRHTANPHEGMDGYDTIEWIAAQPWSNGKVGMVGSSHPGLVQTHAALYCPPHLTAIWPDVAPNNSYRHQVRCGGAMQLHMFGALFLHAQDSQAAMEDPALRRRLWAAMAQMRELVYATPFKPGHTPLAGVPELEETLFDYYTRGAYDEFWSAEFNDFTRYYNRHADIPGTYSSGWYDPYVDAATYAFAALSKQNRAPQRLIVGPWTHMGMRTDNTFVGDMDFGAEGRWGFGAFNAAQLRWYDHWLSPDRDRELNNFDAPLRSATLKGSANGVEDDPPVQIFVMGGGSGRKTAQGHLDHGGRWRAEREWPLARTQYTPYYLHAGGALSPEPPAVDAAPRRFTYDPADPVPTICGPVTGFFEEIKFGQTMDPFWEKYFPPWARVRQIVQDGPLHQQAASGIVGCKPPYLPLAMRPDVLVYETAPLAEAVELTGSTNVRLWISSSAPDTDFTAKLIDVYPPSADYPEGYHLYLCDSIIRCRFRESFERETLMVPGEIYEVTIELPPTSNLFAKGHRIRIDISSSNFPRFDLNPNTGEPLGRHTWSQKAHNTVYGDAAYPSVAVLPVVSSQSSASRSEQ